MSARLSAALCLSLALLLSGCKPNEAPPKSSAALPAAAPAPVAKSAKEVALADFLKTMNLAGKPVLVEFGMVGCALSEQGLDAMIALQKANAVPGMEFVRVESGPDAAASDKYFQDKAPSFPVYKDSQCALAQVLGATAYPTFVMADKFGNVRYTGKYPGENVAQWGMTLVAETKDPGASAPKFGAKQMDVKKLLANKLPDLKDQVKPLSDYLGSRGMVLLFVDTSCPFSGTALKEFPQVTESLAKEKINAVVVNGDDAKSKVQSFYAAHNLGAPVLYDIGPATRESWNVHSVPTVVFITPDQKIGYQGEAVWAKMGAAIESSLGLGTGAIKFTAPGTGFG